MAHDASRQGAENLMQIARRLFGPEHGVELDLPPRGRYPTRPPVDFTSADFDP